MKENPLLETHKLPEFSRINAAHVEPAISHLIDENLREIKKILDENTQYTWQNLIEPLELLEERLGRAWSPVGHMNSVVNSDELRQAYNACLPKLSAYSTEVGQNERLFFAFKAIVDSEDYQHYSVAQKQLLEHSIRDFRLSGVELSAEKKQRYKEVMQELSNLTSKFEENILDATHGWTKHISDEKLLAGLPESAVSLAKQTAERMEKEGWVLNLEFPSYYPTMCYADNRELRYEMYEAYVTRASDEGPNAGKWDNTQNMEQILKLRHEAANILGYDNYAAKSLATKMATRTDQVLDFLNELAQKSLLTAHKELKELRDFAAEKYGVEELEAWDVPYYSEKLRQHKYDISQEEVKPYFPEDKVLSGMFYVVNKLYDMQVKEVTGVDTWHKDVRFFEILDKEGKARGQFYLDLYARPNKRGGAWMDEAITRMKIGEVNQIPVAYLTCNFSPPIGDKPALFTHDEVETLFHEFGHGLHHMLTMVDYPSVSGISGVPWDAVELPSQFMENWCWQKEALDHIAGHFETGEAIPDEMFDRMQAAKNFQSSMQMVRQLEFSIFDFRMHLEYQPDKESHIYPLLQEVREQVAVMHPPSFNRFPHSFSHIFAGGYAAGYYSYKWAEVLSADAFSKFEENGIFDRETGLLFLTSILEQGGSKDPMELFIEFRGREPSIDALLRHTGIVPEVDAHAVN